MPKNYKLSLIPLIIIIALSFFFYNQALTQAGYEGLPTVPCIDYTKSVVQNYTFTISITISGKNYPVPKTYGHDYGQCLHDIYANDSTGLIYVKTNEQDAFTLGNFFDVWHSNFDNTQIFGYQADNGHTLEVYLNGAKVTTGYRDTPLFPDSNIQIVYK